MLYESYNDFHLGDNLIHLHFLRKMALRYPEHQFRHYLHQCHLLELSPVKAGLKNFFLSQIEDGSPRVGRNVWKNADGYWQYHFKRNQWAEFHLEWFHLLANEMGLQSPFKTTQDLLFDFPAIVYRTDAQPAPVDYDVLFVNSQPCSGQFMDYDDAHCLDSMIEAMVKNGLRVLCTNPTKGAIKGSIVPCTRDHNMDVFQIANMALRIPNHVMVATGPMWLTFNVWSTLVTKLRMVMIGVDERITLPLDIEHVTTRDAAWKALARQGVI